MSNKEPMTRTIINRISQYVSVGGVVSEEIGTAESSGNFSMSLGAKTRAMNAVSEKKLTLLNIIADTGAHTIGPNNQLDSLLQFLVFIRDCAQVVS